MISETYLELLLSMWNYFTLRHFLQCLNVQVIYDPDLNEKFPISFSYLKVFELEQSMVGTDETKMRARAVKHVRTFVIWSSVNK